MNRHTRKIVNRLAHDVREWALNQACDFEKDLCGWCAICSAELFKRVTAEGIDAKMVLSEDDFGAHVFLNIDDWVVDVTATQFQEFRNTRVVTMHEAEAAQYSFYGQVSREFNTVKALNSFQRKVGWPESQTARL